MDVEKGKVSVPLWMVVTIAMVVLCIPLTVWYYKIDDSDVKTLGLVGGVIGGLMVYILTFFGYIKIVQQLEFFLSLGVKNLLANRHDKEYYKKIVRKAKEHVDVMGSTCSRFVDDFLDEDSEDHALIDALRASPKLTVKLLIPSDAHLSVEAQGKLTTAKRKLEKVRNEFPGRVELKRFDEYARNSLVVSDQDLITGPIFETDRGKYDPAIHVSASTAFGKKYRKHFDEVWARSVTDQ